MLNFSLDFAAQYKIRNIHVTNEIIHAGADFYFVIKSTSEHYDIKYKIICTCFGIANYFNIQPEGIILEIPFF